jgi:hypothetical protein
MRHDVTHDFRVASRTHRARLVRMVRAEHPQPVGEQLLERGGASRVPHTLPPPGEAAASAQSVPDRRPTVSYRRESVAHALS